LALPGGFDFGAAFALSSLFIILLGAALLLQKRVCLPLIVKELVDTLAATAALVLLFLFGRL
jgi:hypothetical protein